SFEVNDISANNVSNISLACNIPENYIIKGSKCNLRLIDSSIGNNMFKSYDRYNESRHVIPENDRYNESRHVIPENYISKGSKCNLRLTDPSSSYDMSRSNDTYTKSSPRDTNRSQILRNMPIIDELVLPEKCETM